MIEERSAGAVVFYISENLKIEYLLLHYEAGHWDFPKGAIEVGENEVDTARREVWEETGIDNIEIIPNFRREIKYFYKKLGELVKKEVVFYLARSNTKEVRLSYEHKGYIWLEYPEAMRKLTFNTARNVLEAAHMYLTQLYKIRESHE
ncbi:MAG: NUDIX domain-containing protein [Nitrososphaeria archaeon]|nr:NUDIX domain-containing protein [Nitrososphaeria archaeon]MDW7986388.1 NUDIX domain-containing protein [Nitrososphaerota archaeon]